MSDAPWLVVGLGNPGPTYAATRHNVGVMAVERLAPALGGGLGAHRRCRAEVTEGRVGPLGHGRTARSELIPRPPSAPRPGRGSGEPRSGAPSDSGSVRVVAARTRGYMNDSGGPVACLVDFYKVPLDQLVVLHDELDLPLGAIRLKLGGGDNGHNGLRSLRRSLGSGDFHRIRLGIGRPPGRQDPAEFVLRPFAGSERTEVDLLCAEAVDAVEVLVRQGLSAAQNQFNR